MLKKEVNKKIHFYKSSKHPCISDTDLQLKIKVKLSDPHVLKKLYKYHIEQVKKSAY